MNAPSSVPSAPPPHRRLAAVLVPLALAATWLPQVSAGVALLAGIALALTVGNPWPSGSRALAHRCLAWSVVGLGAGMDLAVVGRVGLHGIGYTAVGIGAALTVGTWLGTRLRVARDVSLLITVGTAICGGSAIAAIAPGIRAKEHEVSMALVTVFLLNAVALFVFPAVGRHFHLDQNEFGLWCALAIHDTSSVVGAATQYGARALEVATAAKLARALWIVPVAFVISTLRARTAGAAPEAGDEKPRRPWLIAGFLAVAALVTFVPALRPAGHLVTWLAHRLLAATLCLMGLGLSRPALRALGPRPLLQGVTLWLVLASATLTAVRSGWIH